MKMTLKTAALCAILYINGADANWFGGRQGRHNSRNFPSSGVAHFGGRDEEGRGPQRDRDPRLRPNLGPRPDKDPSPRRDPRPDREQMKKHLKEVCPEQVAYCQAQAQLSGSYNPQAFMDCLMNQPAEGECAELLARIEEHKNQNNDRPRPEDQQEQKEYLREICPAQVGACDDEEDFQSVLECVVRQPVDAHRAKDCAELLAKIQERLSQPPRRRPSHRPSQGPSGNRPRPGSGGDMAEKVVMMLRACDQKLEEACALQLLPFDMDLEQLQGHLLEHAAAMDKAAEAGERPPKLDRDVRDMVKAVHQCLREEVRPYVHEDSDSEESQCAEVLSMGFAGGPPTQRPRPARPAAADGY